MKSLPAESLLLPAAGRLPGPPERAAATLAAPALVLALSACALLPPAPPGPQNTSEPTPAPPCIANEQGSGCLPVAPDSERVDLAPPSFTNPTHIDNRLHPTGVVQSAVYLGAEGGLPFRSEVTLLQATRTIV